MPRSTFAAALVASGLTASTALLSVPAAQSVPAPADALCPDAFPVSDLAKGQPVDGLTVSSGKAPDAFTGEVIGVLNDGIAPDLDMVLVELTSPAIDTVGGIWAGMSGSPVYAEGGRLIGAVSYGLAWGASPVAGVTPAEDMLALLDEPEAAADVDDMAAPRKVALSPGLKRSMVQRGTTSSAEADAGLRRLRMPLGVSGLAGRTRLDQVARKLGLRDVSIYPAGSPATAAAGGEDEIFPGSNLAASLAYGDFSAIGTGTTTVVCGGRPVGFGHPFGFLGDTSLTLHGADALFVQQDLVTPFKVANPTAPVGIIDGDHLAGISGVLGARPETTAVTTTVTTPGRSRTGTTQVSVPDYTSTATAFGLLANLDRVFDRIGKGRSLVDLTVSGTTAGGTPFTLKRTNRYASGYDITFESIFDVYDAVDTIVGNDFTDVDVDAVDITAQVDSVDKHYRVAKVERKVAGVYRALREGSAVRARPGRMIRLRVTLQSRRNAFGTQVVPISVLVPAKARPGMEGMLRVGSAGGGLDEEEFFYGEGEASGQATSFSGLLSELATAPRNDQVSATVDLYKRRGRLTASKQKLVGDVVRGSRFFELRIDF